MGTIKKTHFPRTHLGALVARSGGITQDQAVAAAMRGIENLRGLAMESIQSTIRAIEAVADRAKDNRLGKAEMDTIVDHADQIVSAAAAFGMRDLESVAKSLCDVTDAILEQNANDAASILVHIRALRYFAPGSADLVSEHSSTILADLAKIRTLYPLVRHGAVARPPAHMSPDQARS